MTHVLPTRPNLNHLKHEAKQLLKAHQQGDASVCALLRQLHPFTHASDREIMAAPLQLHDMQFALALSYGFSSWRALREFVVTTTGEHEDDLALLHPESLAETLHAVTDALADDIAIPDAERERVALWLARRQGQPGSYRGLIAPTQHDYHGGASLYTGEPLNSGASIGHILGQEAARCLIQLQVTHPEVQTAIARNVEAIEKFNIRDEHRSYYCCGKCSLSLWRHLQLTQLPHTEQRITHGIRILTQSREANGRWRTFPFFYTLFTLLELNLPVATDELRHAVPACERAIKRLGAPDTTHAHRRKAIVERVLNSVG